MKQPLNLARIFEWRGMTLADGFHASSVAQITLRAMYPIAAFLKSRLANDPPAVFNVRAIVLNPITTGQRVTTMQFEYSIFNLQC
jgi:hypothetical protein